MKLSPVYLQAVSAISALGGTPEAMRAALFSAQDPKTLVLTDRYSPGRRLPLGCLAADVALPDWSVLAASQRSRNNALALAAITPLRPAVDAVLSRFGAARVAVVVGTSTSGLDEGEQAARAYRQNQTFPDDFEYSVQELGSVATFLAVHLGVQGPAHVISTACSSGAKALASGARWLASGMVDAVIAGGVDALSRFTVSGFSALEAVSEACCNPLSLNRRGINLGEAAAFFVMTREAAPVRLAGWGESQDAYHMSAPDPTGRGAHAAMQQALVRAGLPPTAVDYINLHGTATTHNDAMESLAVHALFGPSAVVSSTKPLTGHTLAAAGALEAVIAWHVLHDNPTGCLPGHWWDGVVDPGFPALSVATPGMALGRRAQAVLSNSFAFGGSNCALLLVAD